MDWFYIIDINFLSVVLLAFSFIAGYKVAGEYGIFSLRYGVLLMGLALISIAGHNLGLF